MRVRREGNQQRCFAIRGSRSSLKVLPTKGQVQSAKKELLVKSLPQEWRAARMRSRFISGTQIGISDMKIQVFLLKWWAVMFFR